VEEDHFREIGDDTVGLSRLYNDLSFLQGTTHFEIGIVVLSGGEGEAGGNERGAKGKKKMTRALEDPVQSTSWLPLLSPLRSPCGRTNGVFMGSVEELLVVQNPLVRPPLREEQKRCMEKCPYFPHGSSSTAASSRTGEGTSDPFPYLGGFRTHTHRLGAHGGKK
jgi:hypothetical protein